MESSCISYRFGKKFHCVCTGRLLAETLGRCLPPKMIKSLSEPSIMKRTSVLNWVLFALVMSTPAIAQQPACDGQDCANQTTTSEKAKDLSASPNTIIEGMSKDEITARSTDEKTNPLLRTQVPLCPGPKCA